MEFQNANDVNGDVNGDVNIEDERDERGNNENKVLYVCDCGCNLSFIKSFEFGLCLKTNRDDFIYEDKMDIDWKKYIQEENINTWGKLMELIETSFIENPNDRVWYHLSSYLPQRHMVDDWVQLHFIYIN